MTASVLERALLGPAAPPTDELSQRILDAALVEVSEFGIRRASMESVTRRSGTSRMTVYRRYPGKEALLGAVFQREVQRFLEEVTATMPKEGTLAERVATVFATGMRKTVEHPLYSRLLQTDPEAVLPFVTVNGGPLLDFATAYVRDAIASDEEAEGVSENRIEVAAEAITRLGHSIALTNTPLDCPSRDDLRTLALAVVDPLLGG